jgi:ectoine hydroxylase-related dioxygenase (phytanoyl-CoA dioxygenase family)
LTLAAPLWQVPGVLLTRHALNRVFAWEAHDGQFRRITPAQAAAYDEAGFFVLEDAFDPATLRDVIEEIDPIETRVTAVHSLQYLTCWIALTDATVDNWVSVGRAGHALHGNTGALDE